MPSTCSTGSEILADDLISHQGEMQTVLARQSRFDRMFQSIEPTGTARKALQPRSKTRKPSRATISSYVLCLGSRCRRCVVRSEVTLVEGDGGGLTS